jgi:ATP-binding cassette, subfamily B, bacterial
VETTVAELGPLLRGVAPALFFYRDSEENHILLVLGSKAGVLHLIGPDLGIHRCPAEWVRAALCCSFEAPIADEIDQLIEMAGMPKARRNTVRSALLRERLGKQRLGGCWVLRLPPTTGFWQQLLYVRLPRRALLMLGVFVLVYGLEVLGWGVIGQGALDGRLDAGWLTAWALLVLSLIPLQLLGHWLNSTFALDTGRILKQRLLAGALGMDLESVRRQGAGQLLGRVIESQALESLALNGGLTVLIACVELVFAAWLLFSGAGGRPFVTAAWLAGHYGFVELALFQAAEALYPRASWHDARSGRANGRAPYVPGPGAGDAPQRTGRSHHGWLFESGPGDG